MLIGGVSSGVPLRFHQEAHLLTTRVIVESGLKNPAFNLALTYRIAGPLDIDAVRVSVAAIVERHAALRSRITINPALSGVELERRLTLFKRAGFVLPGAFQQEVVPFSADWELVTCDGTVLQTESDVSAYMAMRTNEPIPYDTAPLLRAVVARYGLNEHVLAVVVPHVVSDGWSMQLLLRDLCEEYRARLEGRRICRKPETSFHDFVVDERARLAAGAFEQHMEFWAAQWARCHEDQLTSVCFPFGKESPDDTSGSATTIMLRLSDDMSRRIRKAAQSACVTPQMFFRCCASVAVRNATGRERVVLWGTFANRSHPGIQNSVGWFNNRHVISVELPQGTNGQDALLRTSVSIRQAVAHEPLELMPLWYALGHVLEKRESHVGFDFASLDDEIVVGPLRLQRVDTGRDVATDFDMRVTDSRESFEISCRFVSSRYDREGVEGLLADMVRIADAIATTPSTSLNQTATRGDRPRAPHSIQ